MGTVVDKLARLSQTKADLRAAILEKGQAVEETDPFAAYPAKVRAIPGRDQINLAREVQVIAANKIQVGDTVYTISGDYAPYLRGGEDGALLSGTVCGAAFSPNGQILVVAGSFQGKVKVYAVDGTKLTYSGDIEDPPALLPKGLAFSADGSSLVVGAGSDANIYSVQESALVPTGKVTVKSISCVAFSPDGTVFVAGSANEIDVFSVDGTTFTAAGRIDLRGVQCLAFSPDGSTLVAGGSSGLSKVYAVEGTTLTEVGNLYADAEGTALNGVIYAAAFSPDGSLLVLGGTFTGRAKVYAVEETSITYISDIYADTEGTTLDFGNVAEIAFSPDGSMLLLVGGGIGWARAYSVNGTSITYIKTVGGDGSGESLAISPDGALLILGLSYSSTKRFAVRYTIDGTDFSFPTEEYASAYKAADGSISEQLNNLMESIGIGYAKCSMEAEETGTVVVIGEVTA
ncbi:WD40 repeat domain-containing protein [Vermiculatibacterium agrestimuris]|uniref:WD40 repeat domain-containing protein n=1 Tax=Vermiculatibacterium agrestimuris TaxID=2941519 RepID=UPI00204239A4|nr:WD40 repeat domain-containing protein [Vermiculatibacterium agrestimuris]